jgi:hypothetical protein
MILQLEAALFCFVLFCFVSFCKLFSYFKFSFICRTRREFVCKGDECSLLDVVVDAMWDMSMYRRSMGARTRIAAVYTG